MIKMPLKIAKMGVLRTDKQTITIFGGVITPKDLEFNYINLVYSLDLETLRWTKALKMN